MKIADGLELLKSMGREKKRLEDLATRESWDYRVSDPGAKWISNFSLEDNRKATLEIDKKMRRLSRAINSTNNLTDIIGINDTDYTEWL